MSRIRSALVPQWLRDARAWWRSRRKMSAVRRSGLVTEDRLAADLRALGIEEGDLLLVHSAMSRLGHLEHGADTVIAALRRCVGPRGTLVLPTFSLTGPMRETLADPQRVFDPATSPSSMGRITETFRTLPGAIRSLHPTHSLSALGPDARHVARGDDSLATNFGADSAFGRVLERNGKIVGLGIDYGPVTFYHVAEDLCPDLFPSVYLPQPVTARIVADGRERTASIRCHDPALHPRRIDQDPAVERAFARIFEERGIAHRGAVGAGTGWWMRARDVVDAILDARSRGVTIYGDGLPARDR